MAPDLIVFLLAQIALDEAEAKAAHLRFPGPWDQAEAAGSTLPAAVSLYDAGDESIGVIRGSYVARHIARHDPARALREVAAKRAILAEHGPADGGRDAGRCRVCTAITHTGMGHADARRFRAPCPTLLFLAAVYSDHPDYRQEWAVSPG